MNKWIIEQENAIENEYKNRNAKPNERERFAKRE